LYNLTLQKPSQTLKKMVGEGKKCVEVCGVCGGLRELLLARERKHAHHWGPSRLEMMRMLSKI